MNSKAHGPHAGAHEAESAHAASLKAYLIGFALSALLTAIPFFLVMTDMLENRKATASIVLLFAVVQIIVHMVFFLHMNSSTEEGWSMLALLFTLILIVIVFVGSLWVMYNLNLNMMPGHDMIEML